MMWIIAIVLHFIALTVFIVAQKELRPQIFIVIYMILTGLSFYAVRVA